MTGNLTSSASLHTHLHPYPHPEPGDYSRLRQQQILSDSRDGKEHGGSPLLQSSRREVCATSCTAACTASCTAACTASCTACTALGTLLRRSQSLQASAARSRPRTLFRGLPRALAPSLSHLAAAAYPGRSLRQSSEPYHYPHPRPRPRLHPTLTPTSTPHLSLLTPHQVSANSRSFKRRSGVTPPAMLGALATGGGLKVPAPIVEESTARGFSAWGCESRGANKKLDAPSADGTSRNLASS